MDSQREHGQHEDGDIKACDLAGILRCLALGVIEAGWHRNDGVPHWCQGSSSRRSDCERGDRRSCEWCEGSNETAVSFIFPRVKAPTWLGEYCSPWASTQASPRTGHNSAARLAMFCASSSSNLAADDAVAHSVFVGFSDTLRGSPTCAEQKQSSDQARSQRDQPTTTWTTVGSTDYRDARTRRCRHR